MAETENKIKKYVSDTSLNTLVNKIKSEDNKVLTEAKKYAKEYAEEYSESISTNYDSAGSAITAETNAKNYTDTKTANLITTSAVNTKISTHNTSTSAHNDIRDLITALTTKLNNFLDVDDTTTDELSEILTLINNNKGTLESLTTSKINVSDIVNNLTTNSTNKVLSAAQGVVIKDLIDALQDELDGHTHTISEVTNLQSSLDSKVPTTRTVNGKALSGNISLSASDVGTYSETEIDNKLEEKSNVGHTHTIANITNLQSTLDSKTSSGHTHTVADITDLTATATELNYMDGVTSNIQTQLNGKQATISGGATTITSSNLTANRALISNGSGKVAVSAVTSTELGYLDGVTSNIQTQLNNKATSSTTLAGYGITDAYTKTEVQNYVASQIGAFLNSSS